MSFASHATSLFLSPPTPVALPPRLHIPATRSPAPSAAGATQVSKLPFTARPLRQYTAISKARTQDNVDEIQKGWQVEFTALKNLEDDTEKRGHHQKLVERIRWMLQNMEDGEISISPYDTAWVALVEDIGGSGQPQFPTCLEWISNNQLADGSWGDRRFLLYDRLLNTLACVVALKTWNMNPNGCDKGLKFMRENIDKVDDENEEHMPVGFEVAFPSLIETAKKLGIDDILPDDDSPGMQHIYAKRDIKLKNIPMDLLHKNPTSLLYTLEGMQGLDWQKLLHFRYEGSFLSSPSSTAYALQHTKDQLCLQYLLKPVTKFNGGVPNVYPVDMFEHLWSVDRLQRLGISRYFRPQIEENMKYVYRYWTNKGICWARNTNVQDIDDTSMGFRLLRMHGYDVTADAFEQFERGGGFCSIPGQSSQGITGMYNMYRSSQVLFPGEHILADARKYAAKFLHEKIVDNAVLDKWIITKDLPGEVGYALDVPWYASLPRLEARFFLEQYGGDDDVWIGKTLYRMLYVNNNTYLDLAKLDYNNCQTLHQHEWKNIQTWYKNCSSGDVGLSERSLLQAYYIAASSVFEPEKWTERIAWAKTAILLATISFQQLSGVEKSDFVNEFEHPSIFDNENGARLRSKASFSLVETLIRTISEISSDVLSAHGKDIHLQLCHVWRKWLRAWQEEGDDINGGAEAELLLWTLHLSCALDELFSSHLKYQQLLEVTTKVCQQLRPFQARKIHDPKATCSGIGTTFQIESNMQELVKLVFTKSSSHDDLESHINQSFFTVARSFYYTAYCNSGTIDSHMAKVLFEMV